MVNARLCKMARPAFNSARPRLSRDYFSLSRDYFSLADDQAKIKTPKRLCKKFENGRHSEPLKKKDCKIHEI